MDQTNNVGAADIFRPMVRSTGTSGRREKRKDMMNLINIQKQKYFYINVQVYTCTFGAIQIVVIVIFTRQEHTKSDIISTVEVGI